VVRTRMLVVQRTADSGLVLEGAVAAVVTAAVLSAGWQTQRASLEPLPGGHQELASTFQISGKA
jgi:hypothetical protein